MKALKIILALAVIVGCFPVASYAQDSYGYWDFTLVVKNQNASNTVVSRTGSQIVDLQLDQYQAWNVVWDASAGVNMTKGTGTLSGNNEGGLIWLCEYQDNDGNWNKIDDMNWITSVTGNDEKTESKSCTIYAKDLRFGYNASFDTAGSPINGKATGYGEMSVTAAPEPTSILAACSILAPLGFVFRRRKA